MVRLQHRSAERHLDGVHQGVSGPSFSVAGRRVVDCQLQLLTTSGPPPRPAVLPPASDLGARPHLKPLCYNQTTSTMSATRTAGKRGGGQWRKPQQEQVDRTASGATARGVSGRWRGRTTPPSYFLSFSAPHRSFGSVPVAFKACDLSVCPLLVSVLFYSRRHG